MAVESSESPLVTDDDKSDSTIEVDEVEVDEFEVDEQGAVVHEKKATERVEPKIRFRPPDPKQEELKEWGGEEPLSKRRVGRVVFMIILMIFISLNWQNQADSMLMISVVLIAAILLLLVAADRFVSGARTVAGHMGISELVIGLTIVSIGTSLPEILVGVSSALEVGRMGGCTSSMDCPTDFALGNIYGSVLVQISLILGIVVIAHPLEVRPEWLHRDGMLMFLAVLLLTAFIIIDGTLDRLEGALLCLLYIYYIIYLIHHSARLREDETEYNPNPSPTTMPIWAAALAMGFGLGVAIWASEHVVESATHLATKAGAPSAFIGATVTAIGTSIPELGVGLVAAKKSKGVAIGTLIGSNITDPLLSIGLAAMVHPLVVSSDTLFFTLIIPSAIIVTGISLLFMWTDFKFQRWEGGVLVGLYVIYLVMLLSTIGML
jgi:cation:H+ antiporter